MITHTRYTARQSASFHLDTARHCFGSGDSPSLQREPWYVSLLPERFTDLASNTWSCVTGRSSEPIPSSHHAFSWFSDGPGQLAELGEEGNNEADASDSIEPEVRARAVLATSSTDMPTGAGLSDDEIEDW